MNGIAGLGYLYPASSSGGKYVFGVFVVGGGGGVGSWQLGLFAPFVQQCGPEKIKLEVKKDIFRDFVSDLFRYLHNSRDCWLHFYSSKIHSHHLYNNQVLNLH